MLGQLKEQEEIMSTLRTNDHKSEAKMRHVEYERKAIAEKMQILQIDSGKKVCENYFLETRSLTTVISTFVKTGGCRTRISKNAWKWRPS